VNNTVQKQQEVVDQMMKRMGKQELKIDQHEERLEQILDILKVIANK